MSQALWITVQALFLPLNVGFWLWQSAARRRFQQRAVNVMHRADLKKRMMNSASGRVALVVFGCFLELMLYLLWANPASGADFFGAGCFIFGVFYLMGAGMMVAAVRWPKPPKWATQPPVREMGIPVTEGNGAHDAIEGNDAHNAADSGVGTDTAGFLARRELVWQWSRGALPGHLDSPLPYGASIWFGRNKPILALVRDALVDGELPKNFILPQAGPGDLPRLPGAADVMDMGRFPADADYGDWLDELVILLADACASGDSSKLQEFLAAHPIVILADRLVALLRGGRVPVPMGTLFFAARGWVENSSNVQLVKLGIVLLNATNVEHDVECRDMLLTLARCDEFSLYVQVLISRWYGANELVFELAQHVHGWGKIRLVERLDVAGNKEMRAWLLAEGCKNTVNNAFLAPACAVKGDILALLREEHLRDEDFKNIGEILSGLTAAGGMPAELDVGECFVHYVRHSSGGQRRKSFVVLSAVQKMIRWCGQQEEDWRELAMIAEAMIAGSGWQEGLAALLAQTLASGQFPEGDELPSGLLLGALRGYDYYADLFAILKQNPLQAYVALPFFAPAPQWVPEVVAYYEELLPLRKIASGMGGVWPQNQEPAERLCLCSILEQLGDFPLCGVKLVETALASPYLLARRVAVRLLQQWCGQLKRPLGDFAPELLRQLEGLVEREVNVSLRAVYHLLIEG